jgi:hypothetical protein
MSLEERQEKPERYKKNITEKGRMRKDDRRIKV